MRKDRRFAATDQVADEQAVAFHAPKVNLDPGDQVKRYPLGVRPASARKKKLPAVTTSSPAFRPSSTSNESGRSAELDGSVQRAPLSVLPIAGSKGRCAGPIPPLCRRKARRDLRSSRQDLEWKQPAPKPSDVRVEACPCFQLALSQVEAVRLRPCRRVERATSHRLRYAEKCELVADRRPIVLR
jgi:hypothetical protein